MQEDILMAMRNSLKDGNRIASLNALHPIKSFEQLKQELGKQYSGDALWAKIEEAARKSTEIQSVGCFVAGTLVHTREGLRPIEQIKVGDYVLSKPENGKGETAYKRVVNTFEFENKETWFVSWATSSRTKYTKDLPQEKKLEILREYVEDHGQSFAVTTPDHPFWVVSSNEENLRWDETYFYTHFPQQQWTRADHLHVGMTLLLADGRLATVIESKRVYKTDKVLQGWIDWQRNGGGSLGLAIDFTDQKVQPCVPINAWHLKPDAHYYDGFVINPNDAYTDDSEIESNPESWYLSKVYNLEVEGCHTYFVDKLGVWVHNTNCGVERLAKTQAVHSTLCEFKSILVV